MPVSANGVSLPQSAAKFIEPDPDAFYILKTPKPFLAKGAFRLADKASPSTRLVSAGSIMPSSQRRAVQK